MKKQLLFFQFLIVAAIFSLIINSCSNPDATKTKTYKIIFLHHSTGDVIWKGGSNSLEVKGIRLGQQYDVPKWFEKYNKENNTDLVINVQAFPKQEPYGWNNYPFDYYNIWVKNAGNDLYMEEPTLEILTKEYNMIIFKHCYPVIDLVSDSTIISIDSSRKTIENYKLQYLALKNKMHEFPNTKFLVWTGAVRVETQSSEESALLAKEFFKWVKEEWDVVNDNIYIWDFYELETEGGLYLKPEYAESSNNSHPNKEFAKKVAPFFCQRIVDVIENNGAKTDLKGKSLD